MNPDWQIAPLGAVPELAGVVADRIWRAWWRDDGFPLSHIAGPVAASLTAAGVPLTLVAHAGGRFLGTASVIESDMAERPDYRPWVAALWVEPDHRRAGIGAALVAAAADAAFGQGFACVFLCATPANAGFYARRGWEPIEADIAGLDIFCLFPNDLASG